MTDFQPFQKIPRLFRPCVVTEKIDCYKATLDNDGEPKGKARKGEGE